MSSDQVDFSDVADNSRATLDAWRECGADRLNPVRFHFIAALARRAADHRGEARRILNERVATLIATYAADVERAGFDAADVRAATRTSTSALTDNLPRCETETLARLIDCLADSTHISAPYPELPALAYFRDVWSKVRAEKQMRQSLAPVSGNAGPLNSSSLVHRALSLMSELSPGYLKQFLSYVDTLSWMEQMNGGNAPAGKETARSASSGRTGRGKAR